MERLGRRWLAVLVHQDGGGGAAVPPSPSSPRPHPHGLRHALELGRHALQLLQVHHRLTTYRAICRTLKIVKLQQATQD